MYTNEKIKELIAKRNKKISELDREIENERRKERARYKFSWKRFLFMLAMVITSFVMIKINYKAFPKETILSWRYWLE